MSLLFFNLLQNEIWACFCVNFLILTLFFRIFLFGFVFTLPAVLYFFEVSYQTLVGLVFLLNYPFSAVFQICLFLQKKLA